MNSDRGTVTQTARVLAVVRLVFGTLQVIGATMGLVFLLETGVSVLTVATVAITASSPSLVAFSSPREAR
jgi:hypothetical protein